CLFAPCPCHLGKLPRAAHELAGLVELQVKELRFMAHTHHEDRSTYYMEQLCTIAICGLLGGVAVMRYYQNILRFILAQYLHVYVLWSGIVLLGLVALRAVGLWRSAATLANNHEHDHEHEHCHDHDHDHAHTHGPDD